LVPSIGSTSHTLSASSRSLPVSSPIESIARKALAQQGADQLLGTHIGLSDRGLVSFQLYREVVAIQGLDKLGGCPGGIEGGTQFRRWHVLFSSVLVC
jgi:hypothetical protein